MSIKTVLAAVALIVAGGGAAAAGGVAGIGAADAQLEERPTNVDATATLTNGTVTLVVTDAGDAFEGVNVSVDHERVGTTDANGTVAFAAGNDSELEVELTAPGFEGELEYVVANGTLVLESEEYEYGAEEREVEEREGEERDDDEREDDERDLPEQAADAPGHDGDLPEEAAEEARENSQRGGPPADDEANDEEDAREADENEDDENEDDEDEQADE
ncbi:hypothetical protein [Halobaculum sp. MBLA0143]|uniref:hypothetical protein n=1 Tax=Halobaculum sp. MBLA0143 TaxID=3079933 RepID=UPI0035242C03